MIPEHLSDFPWNPDYFFAMRNTTKDANGRRVTRVSWDLNDAGIKALLHASPEIVEVVPTTQLVASERGTTVMVTVMLTLWNGELERKWGDVASATSSEFQGGEGKDDRRKYHLAQMAFSRALGRAVLSALGISGDDINKLAAKMKLKASWDRSSGKGTTEDEPDVPEEAEKPVEEMGDVTGLGEKFGL